MRWNGALTGAGSGRKRPTGCGTRSGSVFPKRRWPRAFGFSLTRGGQSPILPGLMTRPPLIWISPDIEPKGREHNDFSISLSNQYQQALMAAGGLPLTMPATTSPELIAECVRRCEGVMLTGGEDVEPGLYDSRLPAGLRRTVEVTPDGGQRDYRELVLIDEVFRQRKPLLAICRGHQILNVALGGTLVADIGRQRPGALNHRRTDRRSEV